MARGRSMAPYWNIGFGVACAAGGFSGKLVLLGTNSGTALGVVGLVLVGVGIYQLIR